MPGVHLDITTISHKVTIECRDIEEITTKEDIVAAIRSKFKMGDALPLETVSLRKGCGGTQTVALVLPAENV